MNDKTNYSKLNKSLDKLISKAILFNIATPLTLSFGVDEEKEEFFPILFYKSCYEDMSDKIEKVDDNYVLPEADFDKLVTKFDNTLTSTHFIISDRKITKKIINDYIYNGFIIYPYTFKKLLKEYETKQLINNIFIRTEEINNKINKNIEVDFNIPDYEMNKYMMVYSDDVNSVLSSIVFKDGNIFKNQYDDKYINLLNKMLINEEVDYSVVDKSNIKEIDNDLKSRGSFLIPYEIEGRKFFKLYKDFIKVGINEIHTTFDKSPFSEDQKEDDKSSILSTLMMTKYNGVYCLNYFKEFYFDW